MTGAALRVAAYCRVSTDGEDQAGSLRSQQSYFRAYIEQNRGWSFTEVFADSGASGTSTRGRDAFHRMIQGAEEGRFDLILTKEVSRFARNTVDALEYTRKLKALGVGVVFLSDNIDTRENDGELRLTIMASIAQEESRKTSQRVKWGQKRRMEAGVVFGNDSTYGFTTRGGKLYVKEDEAAVVRRIYEKCLNQGKGTHIIARELDEEGTPPPKAGGRWSPAMVRRVLRNEKYVGDLCQKKFVTPDYLTHKKEENRGQEEQVYLRDHHAALVDRGTWEAVQEELTRRAAGQGEKTRYSGRRWCSGKIRCGHCGGRFVLRQTKRVGGEIYQSWGCHNRVRYGSGAGGGAGCGMSMLNDKALTACVRFAWERVDLDRAALVSALEEEICALGAGADDPEPGRLEARLGELARKQERTLDAYLSETLSKDEFTRMRERYSAELTRTAAKLRDLANHRQLQRARCSLCPDLTQALWEGVGTSELVLGAVVEEIVVEQGALAVKFWTLPLAFRLWYRTEGRGDGYAVTVERWERCTL